MLKDMISDPQLGKAVLSHLTHFCNLFISGKFPNTIAPFYGSARLIPLVKKDGGVRPMAVGETLRRLACKVALNSISAELPSFFRPSQLGVGTPYGVEAIVHSVAKSLEKLRPNECILQVDLRTLST
jgi:hypothetical protein